MIDPIFQTDNYQMALKLLDATVLQQEAIASNVANAETPGYRRLDVAPTFEAQLKAKVASGELKKGGDLLAPQLVEDLTARSQRPDGNTVEIERELLAMNQNAVRHEFLSDVISGNLRQLKLAITGRNSAA
jgi:flagellar basal-body rod protein FlgB